MLAVRVVVPEDLAEQVAALAAEHVGVSEVVRWRGVATVPAGDVVELLVARESGQAVLRDLEALGCRTCGSIRVRDAGTVLSDAADAAEQAAPGLGVDALVTDDLLAKTAEEGQLSFSYLVFLVAACLVAGIGVVLNAPVLVVGAMVLGPEFGPLAAVAVGVVQRDGRLVRRALAALVVGFALGIGATTVLGLVLNALDALPAGYLHGEHQLTSFVSQPDGYAVLVALIAGVVGMVSLTSGRATLLVGVAISVTTVPAASDVGIAAVSGLEREALGAAGQLGLNLACIVLAAAATLLVQKRLWHRPSA